MQLPSPAWRTQSFLSLSCLPPGPVVKSPDVKSRDVKSPVVILLRPQPAAHWSPSWAQGLAACENSGGCYSRRPDVVHSRRMVKFIAFGKGIEGDSRHLYRG